MRRIVLGVLAHVDAGKTTLCEAMLYHSGVIRSLGRVDHKNTYLDTNSVERERGITVFSKQAIVPLAETEVILLDTPGHVDFSSEMERTLQVLDYAVLIISGTDGVQSHTRTLWNLLQRYHIPTFLFINKMDLDTQGKAALLAELKRELSGGCTDFSAEKSVRDEEIAMLDDELTEAFLEDGALKNEQVARFIQSRTVFPCYFGSALKQDGVEDFLHGLEDFTETPNRPDKFGARVYKIARDGQGNRLTFMKITGGSLRVKTMLALEGGQEKVDQIRIYSGEKFKTAELVQSGMVCAVTGLSGSYVGMGLGIERHRAQSLLHPALQYRVLPQDGADLHTVWKNLQILAEEDPELRLSRQENTGDICVGLMGDVQTEVLRRLIYDRFSMDIAFDEGSIVYRETIADTVEGVGHYEPLRHYAEVHLLMEPAEPGSGLHFDTVCSEDVLSRNWQRLIFTHLMEKNHRGVLIGAPITDMRITILCGKAHLKHTEGGDFRQATYRAIRQGLKKAKSVLLEPWYAFRLEVPQEASGRAMADLDRMKAEFSAPELRADGTAVLRGNAPVRLMRGYAREISAYTHGKGKIELSQAGYRPCTEQEQVVSEFAYDAERDLENPCGSVFCEHGAGYEVKWDAVDAHAHLPLFSEKKEPDAPQTIVRTVGSVGGAGLDKELQSIFERTYGAIRRRDILPSQTLFAQNKKELIAALPPCEEYLLVDGYNILFGWECLRDAAKENIDAARHILMNMLCNYQAYKGCAVILVFDAYRVFEGLGSVEKFHNIHIVYTKQAETADQYIERVTYALAKHRRVRVATSDGLEQLIILGHGAMRVSAREFEQEVLDAEKEISRIVEDNNRKNNERI